VVLKSVLSKLNLLTGSLGLSVVVLFGMGLGMRQGVCAQDMTTQLFTRPSGPSKPLSSQKNLSLDFQNADLHDVLRILAEEGRFNLVVTDDVQGQVTLRLSEVTWEQALGIVLQAHGLMLRQQGSIFFVNYSTGP
jgi:type II secretory pathway component HofQ